MTVSSSLSPAPGTRSPRRRRSTARSLPSPGPTTRPIASGSACTRASRSSAPRDTSGSTSSSRRASAPRRTASRSSSHRRRATSSGEAPLADASYRALGRHRLKDVPNAVQLFQLVAPDLREDFPPLKTLTATSLPALHHRLVGRAGRARAGRAPPRRAGCATRHHHRAREAQARAGSRSRSRPARRSSGPCTSSGSRPIAGCRARAERDRARNRRARVGGQPLVDAIADRLERHRRAALPRQPRAPRRGAAVHVAALLDRAPDLQVLDDEPRTAPPLDRARPARSSLSRSRTRPRCSPSSPPRVASSSARRRLRRCTRSADGWTGCRSPSSSSPRASSSSHLRRSSGRSSEGLALEMEGPIDLPERQRTLRAAIDWSYGRLTESQQRLHGALAVFSDGARRSTTRARSRPSPSTFLADLEALVGWSLVRSEASDGTVRLSMLGDGSRACSRPRSIESGGLDDLREHHAERFLRLALDAESELTGTTRPRGSTAWSSSSTTSPPRSTGCSPSAASPTRCARSRRSSASGAAMRTSRRRGAGSRTGLESAAETPSERACGGAAHGLASRGGAERLGRSRSRSLDGGARALPRPRRRSRSRCSR